MDKEEAGSDSLLCIIRGTKERAKRLINNFMKQKHLAKEYSYRINKVNVACISDLFGSRLHTNPCIVQSLVSSEKVMEGKKITFKMH